MSETTSRMKKGFTPTALTLAIWGVVVVLLVLGLASCAKPPEAEVAAASTAIDQAKAKDALEYASAEYRAVVDSMAAVRAELDRQKGKFVLFRSYKVATQKALAVQAAAAAAGETAVRNKELARQEAERVLAETERVIAETRALLDSPVGKRLMRAKEAREAITQIVGELDATEASLADVREGIANTRYKVAARMGNESLQRAQNLRGEVQKAIDAISTSR